MESVDLVDYEVPWLGPALFNPTLIVELSQGPYACFQPVASFTFRLKRKALEFFSRGLTQPNLG